MYTIKRYNKKIHPIENDNKMTIKNLKELVRPSWKISNVFGHNRLARLRLRANYFQVTLNCKT